MRFLSDENFNNRILRGIRRENAKRMNDFFIFLRKWLPICNSWGVAGVLACAVPITLYLLRFL